MKESKVGFRWRREAMAPINRRTALQMTLVVAVLTSLWTPLASAEEDDAQSNCPPAVREGYSGFMLAYWPGSSSMTIPIGTLLGDYYTATPGADFDAYRSTLSGDPHSDILRIPVVTRQDSLVEHEETFGVGFQVEGEWYACVIRILDDDAPKVTNVQITSRPVRFNAYRTGESVDVTVTFDKEVEVEGNPLLSLYLGHDGNTSWRGAKYHHGSGSRDLTFRYQVQPADRDDDGIFVSRAWGGPDRDPDHGFSGRIYAKGTDVQVNYFHPGLGPEAHHLVDGRPLVVNTRITSRPPDGWNAYRANQLIEISMGFDIEVEVEGGVSMTLYVGMDGNNWDEARRYARYLRGSGSDTLVFGYTIRPGDMDSQGVMIGGGRTDERLVGNGGIKAKGTDVEPYPWYLGSDHQPDQRVDTEPPAIEAVAITSQPANSDTYNTGETIRIGVVFTEEVTISGCPQLALDIGGTTGMAGLATGNTGDRTFVDEMVFQYQVQEGDTDTDGIGIDANSLRLNGGGIHDRAGNAAGLFHDALVVDPGHKVNTTPDNPR